MKSLKTTNKYTCDDAKKAFQADRIDRTKCTPQLPRDAVGCRGIRAALANSHRACERGLDVARAVSDLLTVEEYLPVKTAEASESLGLLNDAAVYTSVRSVGVHENMMLEIGSRLYLHAGSLLIDLRTGKVAILIS
jgi:hypothetical protein